MAPPHFRHHLSTDEIADIVARARQVVDRPVYRVIVADPFIRYHCLGVRVVFEPRLGDDGRLAAYESLAFASRRHIDEDDLARYPDLVELHARLPEDGTWSPLTEAPEFDIRHRFAIGEDELLVLMSPTVAQADAERVLQALADGSFTIADDADDPRAYLERDFIPDLARIDEIFDAEVTADGARGVGLSMPTSFGSGEAFDFQVTDDSVVLIGNTMWVQ